MHGWFLLEDYVWETEGSLSLSVMVINITRGGRSGDRNDVDS